jgi:hypothetical protein
MFYYQGLSKSINELTQILDKNSVTGCTMKVNRKAIEVSFPILSLVVMHDWWIAANVIKHQGVVDFIDESLIQYRQHNSNSVGAKEKSFYHLVKRIYNYLFYPEAFLNVWYQTKSIEPNFNRFCFFWKKIHLTIKSLF